MIFRQIKLQRNSNEIIAGSFTSTTIRNEIIIDHLENIISDDLIIISEK